MARIKILSWNIQVYGPKKYSHPVNGVPLVNFIAAVANHLGANLLVVYETMTSVADQVNFNVTEGLAAAAGGNWLSYGCSARASGDRESYGFYWNTGAEFQIARTAANHAICGLSTLEFPNNFSAKKGRRAAYVSFLTTDTHRRFTTTAYHAPPNARAIQGLAQLAKMSELYELPNPAVEVPHRLLAGDYNLDVNVQPDYTWLTDPLPAGSNPAISGQKGAECVRATNGDTGLATYRQASAHWSANPDDYIRPLAIDNIFWNSPTGAAHEKGVVDVLRLMMNAGTPIRQAAEAFSLTLPAGGPAFTHAADIPAPLNVSLNQARYSYILYRYAVSDHLPVFLSVDI